mmetsp:Transcript_54126/g.154409  ORF Transcript_54126/g.154409 Transcript_54126/m.154409 type:complete len:370 (+) Transcript_54126:113-1222(+)
MTDSAANAKTDLVEFAQRYLGKSMDKGDIEYVVVQQESLHQATVTLHCMDKQQFAGELCETEKAAQLSAALIALTELQNVIGKLEKGTKRKGAPGDGSNGEDVLARNKLREAVRQILGRDIIDGDLVYDTKTTEEGQTCTVTLPTMEGSWSIREFPGSASPFKRDAMLSAASVALEAILAAEEFAGKVDLSKVREQEGKKKKKSATKDEELVLSAGGMKGKGKMANPWAWQMASWGKGDPWGKGGPWGMGDAWGMGDLWGKGSWDHSGKKGGKGEKGGKKKARDGPSGPDLPRERISESPITGEVISWKGKFGYIKPHVEVVHPTRGKCSKVYVHTQDICGIELEKGSTVQFEVYSDAAGVGAEEVVLI